MSSNTSCNQSFTKKKYFFFIYFKLFLKWAFEYKYSPLRKILKDPFACKIHKINEGFDSSGKTDYNIHYKRK